MNVFTFDGRLGKDSELNTVGESQVCNFRLANNVGWGDNQITIWLGCALWGARAAALHPYLLKGQQVLVSGELKERAYTREDGTNGTALEVRVGDLTLVGGRGDGEDAPAATATATAPASKVAEEVKW